MSNIFTKQSLLYNKNTGEKTTKKGLQFCSPQWRDREGIEPSQAAPNFPSVKQRVHQQLIQPHIYNLIITTKLQTVNAKVCSFVIYVN